MWLVTAPNGEALPTSGCWQLKKRRLKNTGKEEEKNCNIFYLLRTFLQCFVVAFIILCVVLVFVFEFIVLFDVTAVK